MFLISQSLAALPILASLLIVSLVALNPAKQFAKANNAKRASDVNALTNAVYQYYATNRAVMPAGLSTKEQEISSSGADLCHDLVPEFIANLPADPKAVKGTGSIKNCNEPYNTHYTIQLTPSNRVIITAPEAEAGAIIKVMR